MNTEKSKEEQLRTLHHCKGKLHLRVYNCVDRLISVWGGVDSNTCKFRTQCLKDEKLPCDLCKEKAHLFEFRFLYEDQEDNGFMGISCPSSLDLDLCASCTDIDKILTYVTEGPKTEPGVMEYLYSFVPQILLLAEYKKPKPQRYFTSFQSLEVARDEHDIKKSYEKSQQHMSEQFYSQMNKCLNSQGESITISLVPY